MSLQITLLVCVQYCLLKLDLTEHRGTYGRDHLGSVSIRLPWSYKFWSNFARLMMNFSIMCTAIPSLGRLIVELQPEVNAFAITEQHGLRSADKYALSSFGHRFPNAYVINNRLGAHVSARRSRSKNRDSDSIRGLAQDSMAQNNNVIKHTVDFEVKYMEEGEPC